MRKNKIKMVKYHEGQGTKWGKNERYKLKNDIKVWVSDGSGDIRLSIDGSLYNIPKDHPLYEDLNEKRY